MIEVEVKLPVAELEEIQAKIVKQGFCRQCSVRERDTYFDDQEGRIRGKDQALRVRETTDRLTGKVRAQLNYKGEKMDRRTVTREELETGVEDGKVCRDILRALGYTAAEPEVIKERDMLKKGNVTACLDKVHGLGSFLELEILVESEREKEIALQRIETILNSIGYRIADTVRNSYLSMLQGGED